MPRSEVTRLFGVSRATLVRYLQLRRETGGLAPRPRRGPAPLKTAGLQVALLPRLEQANDATLEEPCTWWEQASGVRVSTTAMSRVITKHLGWTRKKDPERQRARRDGPRGLARAHR